VWSPLADVICNIWSGTAYVWKARVYDPVYNSIFHLAITLISVQTKYIYPPHNLSGRQHSSLRVINLIPFSLFYLCSETAFTFFRWLNLPMMNGLLRCVLRDETGSELENTFVRGWRQKSEGTVFVLLDSDLLHAAKSSGQRILRLVQVPLDFFVATLPAWLVSIVCIPDLHYVLHVSYTDHQYPSHTHEPVKLPRNFIMSYTQALSFQSHMTTATSEGMPKPLNLLPGDTGMQSRSPIKTISTANFATWSGLWIF
jgi:hypothetical protein